MTYDLRAAVLEVLDTSDLADLGDIAAKVAENIPARELRAALAESLRIYVQQINTQRRMSNPILHSDRVQSARSAKVAGIRDRHAAWLRDLIHVDGGHKPLGECTYEDLMFAAEERRVKARQNATQADRFEEIAKLLQAHSVETVAELPTSVLSEAA